VVRNRVTGGGTLSLIIKMGRDYNLGTLPPVWLGTGSQMEEHYLTAKYVQTPLESVRGFHCSTIFRNRVIGGET
jgi:hypothetical protein